LILFFSLKVLIVQNIPKANKIKNRIIWLIDWFIIEIIFIAFITTNAMGKENIIKSMPNTFFFFKIADMPKTTKASKINKKGRIISNNPISNKKSIIPRIRVVILTIKQLGVFKGLPL